MRLYRERSEAERLEIAGMTGKRAVREWLERNDMGKGKEVTGR